MKAKLTNNQLARAAYFWEDMKLDTLEIALRLGLGREGEPAVWRSLAERRDFLRDTAKRKTA